jgi:HSP20 family protein
VDVTTTDKEVKVVAEMPGISKDKIIVNAYDNRVEVKSEDPRRKYHRTFEIPPETDIETAKSAYNNGILGQLTIFDFPFWNSFKTYFGDG